MVGYRHKAVSDNGRDYLDADDVLRGTPEPLDLEMLLQPLVKNLGIHLFLHGFASLGDDRWRVFIRKAKSRFC